MLKTLALENFWPSFSSRKASGIHVIKKTDTHSAAAFWLAVALIAVNAALLMSYIYGVNQFANTGYQISALQKQLATLADSNNKLNMQVAESTSMVSIQQDFLNSNFVAAGTPKFLRVPTVAER